MRLDVTVHVDDAVLKALPEKARRRLEDVLLLAGHNVERRAKGKVPVKTGATRSSIHVDNRKLKELEVSIGPSTFYAPYLEFGTRYMAARPFMVPSLEEERLPFTRAAEQVLKEAASG